MSEDKIIIFDTTLRDGEQSAGIGMTGEEKLEIAIQLGRLRVDVIEAGFAASSAGDFQAVKTISQEVKGPVITSLARAHPADVDQAWDALKGRGEPTHPRLPFQLRHSPDAPTPEEPRGGHGHGGVHGEPGQELL